MHDSVVYYLYQVKPNQSLYAQAESRGHTLRKMRLPFSRDTVNRVNLGQQMPT